MICSNINSVIELFDTTEIWEFAHYFPGIEA